MSEVYSWSTSAAGNNAAPPNGFPELMQRRDYNDAARELMAAVRRWYAAPEWLNLVSAYTVSRIDANTVRIAGVDLSAAFNVGRRVKLTGGGDTEAQITAVAFAAGNTDVDVTGTVPVGTNGILAYFGARLRDGAFAEISNTIGDLAAHTSTGPLLTGAYKNHGDLVGDLALHTSAGPLLTGAYKNHGNNVGDLALHTATGPLATGAYRRQIERTYRRKSSDQAISASTETLVTTLADVGPVVVSSGAPQSLIVTLVLENTGSGGNAVTLRVRVGAAGTLADGAVFAPTHFVPQGDTHVVTFMLQVIPLTGHKVSVSVEGSRTLTVKGSASGSASTLEIMDYGV